MTQSEGSGRATLVLATQSDGGSVQVNVQDSGCGVDSAVRDTLFDAFQTTKADGMGMGLAISRSIIEAHGGRLWFTPNPDRGATFSFRLPAASQEEMS